MITCAECIDGLRPDDPRVKSGRYHLSGCDYCNKPQYYRDLEHPKLTLEIPDLDDPIEIRQLRYQVKQARAGLLYLQNKLNEHIDKARAKTKDKI